MITKSKSLYIHSTPEKVFAQMDDFSKTRMHMTESSMMMMMGSKLKLEQVSTNATVVGDELFYAYLVDNQAIVIPETIDAIRALTGIETLAENSLRKTNESLGIRRGSFI